MLTKETVLIAANELFNERGYVKITDLASKMGLNYHYIYSQILKLREEQRWPFKRCNRNSGNRHSLREICRRHINMSAKDIQKLYNIPDRQYRSLKTSLAFVRNENEIQTSISR